MYFTRKRLIKYNYDELCIIWIKEGLNQKFLQNKTKEDIINFLLNFQKENQIPILGYFRQKIHEIIDKICETNILENNIDKHLDIIDIFEIENEKCCIICEENKRFFAGKCGHFILCGKCSKNLWSKNGLCPICREPWKDVRKIFI